MTAAAQQYPAGMFGMAVAVSMLAALLLAVASGGDAGFAPGVTARALLLGTLAGLFCARAAAVLFNLDLFHMDWLGVLRVYEGGYLLNFGLMGGVAAAGAYAARTTRRAPAFLDAVAVPLFAGLALGQLACLFNGEGVGFRVPAQYAYFPFAVLTDGGAFFPLFLARALWYCAICGALRLIAPTARRAGDVMLWGVMLYCAAGVVFESMSHSSVFVEFVRVDQALCMAVVLILTGVLFRRSGARGGSANIAPALAVPAMTGVAFYAEFNMGASMQAAFWTLMALALAVIIVCAAMFYSKARR